MSAISNTSTTMPTTTAAVSGGGATTKLPGAIISSTGGQTTLPAASASDFTGPTNQLDAPDTTYSTMSISHVAAFRAMGTPEDLIAQIASEQPDPAVLDAYIQDEIMRNPEAWDSRTGRQPGTARAGLQQLIPGVVLGGRAPTSGVAPQAMFTPTSTEGGGMTKAILGTAAVGILGIGGFLLGKRHAAKGIETGIQALDATRVQHLGMMASDAMPGVVGGGGGSVGGAAAGAFQVAGGGFRMQDSYAAHVAQLAIEHGDGDALRRSVMLNVAGSGHASALDDATTLQALMHDQPVGDPRLSRLLATSNQYGADQKLLLDTHVKLSLIDKLDGRAAANILGGGASDAAAAATPTAPGSLDDVIARLAVMRLAQQST